MIAELILLKFSVCYNLNYLASLLKKLGLSSYHYTQVTLRESAAQS